MVQFDLLAKSIRAVTGQDKPQHGSAMVVALAGNPNAGKTELFNALTGLRSRTANYPGTTVERKLGYLRVAGKAITIVDLPGMYSLRAVTPEEQIAHDILTGKHPEAPRPDGVVLIVDADNLERNLFLVSQIRELEIPVIVALNMIDIAERHGIQIDAQKLSRELHCPVIPMVAKTGRGVDTLKAELERWVTGHRPKPLPLAFPRSACRCDSACACPAQFQSRFNWSESVAGRCLKAPVVATGRRTEKLDRLLTHPVAGLLSFLAVMLSVFYLIFSVASVPMDLIDGLFARAGDLVAAHVPPGDFQSLLVHGIIGGVGGILVFLPQICILFFFLGILEDSGYLARAAFVMDRLMRRVGLPGTAFVPLLSAHACAIPAIMAARIIKDRRDRLVTILVAPLMSCSARIPVYAMVTALLFPTSPGKAALVFTAAYGSGIVAALIMAFAFKKTILRGETKPLVLELPGYKIPGLRNLLLYTFDRAKVFVQQAGSIILVISLILWALATYPKTEPSVEVSTLAAQAQMENASGNAEGGAMLEHRAADLAAREALAHSFAGRLGHLIEPVVRPLGFDWQIGIGIISSFAAREVIVSTLSIVYGVGEDAATQNREGLYDTLRNATRRDGSRVFTTASSLSLLVFYILAMQCMATQVITRRETGSWKWPILQFSYMSALAYGGAYLTFQGLTALGFG
ncbi:MAG: ferrous iron transport protein B [Lentisphaerae bacterium]|nr:ferrous iron transport protein B [Lentisphaerota bacterium]